MKKLSFIILLAFNHLANAQLVDIKYIPTISTDTISTKAQLYTNLLSKDKFNPMVFENGVKVGERRQSVTLRSKDFFYIEFIDKKNNRRVFQQVPELGKAGKLFEVMLRGKISWYRRYFNYKADAWDQNIAFDDYFVKGKEVVKIPVKGKYKRKLKSLVSDKPELAQEVERMINDTDIREILEKYNKD